MSRIPLLSPRAFVDYTAETFHHYVKSLYVEPPKPAPLAEYAVRLNAKGNPVLTVRRKPKYLTSDEVQSIATELGFTLQKLWIHITKAKKIEIRVPDCRSKRK
jgi:hypothetical protein